MARATHMYAFCNRFFSCATIAYNNYTIVSWGNKVYLAASSDPALRGLLIEVDSNSLPNSNTAENDGQITAERGNVTLAGLIVLGQALSGRALVGIALVIAASVGASRRARAAPTDI